MKITRFLTMGIVLLGLSGVARAITFRVLDPSGSQHDFPAVNVGGSNSITFYQKCFNFTAANPGGCFALANATDDVLTSFVGTIDSPMTLDDSTESSSICPTDGVGSLPNSFSTVDCSIRNNVITIDLSGPPGIQPYSAFFYLVETGIPAADFLPNETYGSFTVTATPEPSSLWLALTGLGPLGYALRRRRGAAKA